MLNSFKKHLATHTTKNAIPIEQTDPTSVTINNLSLEHINVIQFSTNNSNLIPSTSSMLECGSNNLNKNTIDKFLASLYANPQIPRNVVQTVIEDMTVIFDNVKQTLKNKTNKLLIDGKISNKSLDHFNNILEEFEHPFSDLGT